MVKEQINNMNKFIEIDNELTLKYYEFIKNLILISIGILTAIISLIDSENISNFAINIKNVVIISLGIGILSAIIVLYGEIAVLKLVQNKFRELINSNNLKNVEILQIDRPKKYKFFEVISFLSYTVFIISLIIFGIYK